MGDDTCINSLKVYLQTPRPVHRPHNMAEDTRRNMTPEKRNTTKTIEFD